MEASLESGEFISCGEPHAGEGEPSPAEFGTPQTPIDEDDPESELTPIEPYVYDNPSTITLIGGSNIRGYFVQLLNDVEITVNDVSKIDIELYETTSNVDFVVLDARSNTTYRGGTEGLVTATLPNCIDTGCFRTSGDLNEVNFLGEENDGVLLPGGVVTIGVLDKDNREVAAEVVIENLIGNGTIDLSDDSKVTINNYEVEYDDNRSAIYLIQGRGEVVFNTEVHINLLQVRQAEFNDYAKIFQIAADSNGNYNFNSNADIKRVDNLTTLNVNEGSHVLIEELGNITEANIVEGATLEIIGDRVTSGINNNDLGNVQGLGTLHLNQPNETGVDYKPFSLNNANLNKLLLDGGKLIISNDSPDYTHEVEDSNDEDTVEDEVLLNKISNVDKNDTALGGEILMEGSMFFEHIHYLNSLVLCEEIGDPSEVCSENTNVTLRHIDYLGSLIMNDGQLNLFVSKSEDKVISAESIDLNSGKIVALFTNTPLIKNKDTFPVIRSNSSPLSLDVDLYEIDTSLPDWYRNSYRLSNDERTLLVDIERLYNYQDIISRSEESNNKRALKVASIIDNLVKEEVPIDITGVTITYLDIFSNNNYEQLAQNIESLIPLSNNMYLQNSHFTNKEALDISKSYSMSNNISYAILNHYDEIVDNNLWFVTSFNRLNISEYNQKSDLYMFQLGANLYKVTSPQNSYQYSYSLGGGFSKGKLRGSENNTKVDNYNLSGIFDYRNRDHTFKFSLLYGLSLYDTRRDYFINTYTPEEDDQDMYDIYDINDEKLQSLPKQQELLFDFKYSYTVFLEYLRSFSAWKNTRFIPKVYITPAIMISNEYQEEASYSSVTSNSYIAPFIEGGVGGELIKDFNLADSHLLFSLDGFTRYYNKPDHTINFSDASNFKTTVENSRAVFQFFLQHKTAISFDYKSSNFLLFYKQQILNFHKLYSHNIGFSYQFKF